MQMASTVKKTTSEFIEKAKSVHGDRYDYSLVEYTGNKNRVKIICPSHGLFEQIASNHIKGSNCYKCKIDKLSKINTKNTEWFIFKANLKHKNRYNYSLVDYVKRDINVKIICCDHGVFEQTPQSHLRGSNCPICANEIGRNKLSKLRTKTLADFILDAKERHGERYDYSLVNYRKNSDKVIIICKIHGEFEQSPSVHLRGSGCQKCGTISTTNDILYMQNKCKDVHSDKYSYDFSEYKNNYSKIGIYCSKHGWFKQRYNNHCDLKQECPSCKSYRSKGEMEIYDFIKSLNINVINNIKGIINEEIDIYLPDLKIAIEYDGEYWHSNHNKEDKCEYNKMIKCQKENISLMIFRNQEWIDSSDIIKSMIRSKIGRTVDKIYARKCSVRVVDKKSKSLFLLENHIQGNSSSSIDLGLYYNESLVSLMTFCNLRKSMGSSSKKGYYELARFCSKLNISVVGGFSKLLNFFIKNYNPYEITSYANRRWSNGNVYERNGFDFVRNSPPNYKYLISNKLVDRFNFRKDILVRNGHDKNKTEKQIMDELGHPRLYDCGSKVYKLRIKKQIK